MLKSSRKERRLHPRIDEQLPVEVVANGYDFSTNTQNISCLGTYCHIDKYVPPFTKVMIKMKLPGAPKDKKRCDVECKGVIVRTEDEEQGGYNIAIFFNGIKDIARQKIAHYISSLMPHNVASA